MTVLGVDDVTSTVPAVIVNVPAIPSTEAAANFNDVAFRVTL